MDKKKKCEHKSFEWVDKYWLCQWCKKTFSPKEIEDIMVSRRQGFDMGK